MQNHQGQTLKAGVIIIKTEFQIPNILLVFRYKEQDWSFPKGHMEADETPHATAIRETHEETGLTVMDLKPLPPHEYTSTHEFYSVYCHMFYTKSFKGTLTPEAAKDRVAWYPQPEILKRLSDDHLKAYYSTIIPLLK